MPCWQGVQPGVTSVDAALARINTAVGFAAYKEACFNPPSDACVRYRWSTPDDGKLSTEMEVGYGEIGAVMAWNPGFTLGDALLTLNDLHLTLYGAYQGEIQSGKFVSQLLFADSHLSVRAVTPCPGTYLDLIETPVNIVMVDSAKMGTQSSLPSFAAVLRMFYESCARQ